jgi:hypothetical protein
MSQLAKNGRDSASNLVGLASVCLPIAGEQFAQAVSDLMARFWYDPLRLAPISSVAFSAVVV